MTLDVYGPAGATEKFPAAVSIHGDLADPKLVRDIKDWGQYRAWGELTASASIAAVTINYRSPHLLVVELAVGQDRGAHAELSELEDAGHAEGGGGGQRAASS
jgi:hypothetical protein